MFTGGGGDNAIPVNVIVHGAVYETITIQNVSNGKEIVCETNRTGEGMVTVFEGESYILSGSISGYSSDKQLVSHDTSDLYAMPVNSIYWYGNECTNISGGFDKFAAYVDGSTSAARPNANNYLTFTKNTNHLTASISKVPTNKVAAIATKNKIDLSKYTKIGFEAFDISGEGGSFIDIIALPNEKISAYTYPYARLLDNGKVKLSSGEIDISSLTASYNISLIFTVSVGPSSASTSIKRIWLE